MCQSTMVWATHSAGIFLLTVANRISVPGILHQRAGGKIGTGTLTPSPAPVVHKISGPMEESFSTPLALRLKNSAVNFSPPLCIRGIQMAAAKRQQANGAKKREKRTAKKGQSRQPPKSAKTSEKSAKTQCHAEGGATKGGVSKCEQNADKRRQTRTNASKRRGANASKREQTWTNANKRLHPPLLRFFYTPPLQHP